MRRRDFITLLGSGAAMWPLGVGAQKTMPVIGWLGSTSPQGSAIGVAMFRSGLKAVGFIEGQNLEIEYRWAEDRIDRLPALATDLVDRRVSLIVTGGGTPVALAAKQVTSTIPIVFQVGADPVRAGIVANLNRPGGNITGVAGFTDQIIAKRLQLIAELVPDAPILGALLNPTNSNFQNRSKDLQAAARAIGRELRIVLAADARQIDTAFASGVEQRIGALIVQNDTTFNSHRNEIVGLTIRHKLPAIYENRADAVAGGLLSYGADTAEIFRLLASYAARVLRGANPGELPVVRPTKFELIINARTAKTLGINVPLNLQQLADEVIE
jgi:putative ABC transport system substrate-binding protein